MTYIENIFLCMVSPLLVAALCMGRRQLRFFLFCIAGMGVCLLSAYINTFLAAVCQADALAATAEIAPVVEEMMKLLPLVFYLLVFEPEGDKIKAAAITVALAFATFENVCYLIQNGADRFSFIFFRGFGTGAMHVLCGLIVGGGLAYTWRRTWLLLFFLDRFRNGFSEKSAYRFPETVLLVAVIKLNFSAFYGRKTSQNKQSALPVEHGRKSRFSFFAHDNQSSKGLSRLPTAPTAFFFSSKAREIVSATSLCVILLIASSLPSKSKSVSLKSIYFP